MIYLQNIDTRLWSFSSSLPTSTSEVRSTKVRGTSILRFFSSMPGVQRQLPLVKQYWIVISWNCTEFLFLACQAVSSSAKLRAQFSFSGLLMCQSDHLNALSRAVDKNWWSEAQPADADLLVQLKCYYKNLHSFSKAWLLSSNFFSLSLRTGERGVNWSSSGIASWMEWAFWGIKSRALEPQMDGLFYVSADVPTTLPSTVWRWCWYLRQATHKIVPAENEEGRSAVGFILVRNGRPDWKRS